ncbi:MAG: hypothetical protein RL722_10 [Pseudomonadota bacterium]|jgi:hypothetical protein
MTRHLVFLLEGPSEKDALESWLPRLLPQTDFQAHYIVFDGKQDMERRMVLKLRHWQLPNSRFIVLRDQDSADCRQVKASLAARCREAGRPDAIVRVACHELETFFLGDWPAVGKAFGNPKLADLTRRAVYRDPDHIALPEAELRRHVPGYQKREGARRIAPHMTLTDNRSRSFTHLRDTILRLAGDEGGY